MTYAFKTFISMAATALVCLSMLVSCSSDDDDDKGGQPPVGGDNTFTCMGQTITAVAAEQYFYGPYYAEYGSDANDIELYIGDSTGKFVLVFDVLVSSGTQKLVSGIYSKSDELRPMSFTGGAIFENGQPVYEISGGLLTIGLTGDTYMFHVNCTLTGGGTIEGKYTGSCSWFDER